MQRTYGTTFEFREPKRELWTIPFDILQVFRTFRAFRVYKWISACGSVRNEAQGLYYGVDSGVLITLEGGHSTAPQILKTFSKDDLDLKDCLMSLTISLFLNSTSGS